MTMLSMRTFQFGIIFGIFCICEFLTNLLDLKDLDISSLELDFKPHVVHNLARRSLKSHSLDYLTQSLHRLFQQYMLIISCNQSVKSLSFNSIVNMHTRKNEGAQKVEYLSDDWLMYIFDM